MSSVRGFESIVDCTHYSPTDLLLSGDVVILHFDPYSEVDHNVTVVPELCGDVTNTFALWLVHSVLLSAGLSGSSIATGLLTCSKNRQIVEKTAQTPRPDEKGEINKALLTV